MAIAYLILVHADPAQLARLVAALPASSPIFVHVDRRAPAETFAAMQAQLGQRVTFVRRHACRWGDAGIVRATAALIAAALGSGARFGHATLLSGADYPIKPDAAIASFLDAHPGTEFIECFSLLEHNRWSEHGGVFRTPDKVLNYHLRFRSRVWRLPWRRRLPYDLKPFGGGQWWTLTRDALAYVDRYLADHPKLMRFARGIFIPDESLIQIVLGNSPFAGRLSGDPLRLAIWDRPEPPYPATLGAEDLPLLAASPALFARKFSLAREPEAYDQVDAVLRHVEG